MAYPVPEEPLTDAALAAARTEVARIFARLREQLQRGDGDAIVHTFSELLAWVPRFPTSEVRGWSQSLEAEMGRRLRELGPERRGWVSRPQENRRSACVLLGGCLFLLPIPGPEKAERLYRMMQEGLPCHYSESVYRLMAHGPDTPRKLLRDIAVESPKGAHPGLASSPRMAQDRTIGPLLRGSEDPQVHYQLLTHARGAQFRHSFARLAAAALREGEREDAEQTSEAVSLALRSLEAPGSVDLEPGDLFPLLQSSRSEARIAALRAQGRIVEARGAGAPGRLKSKGAGPR